MSALSESSRKNSEEGLGDMTGLRNLAQVESDYDDNDRLDRNILGNKFRPEFKNELDDGKGRDDLVEYVWEQFGDEYGTEKVADLQVYLLDELDERGELIGKEVFEYVQEFEDENGSPDYISE